MYQTLNPETLTHKPRGGQAAARPGEGAWDRGGALGFRV